MDNSWKQNLRVSEDKEEKRILELQRKIKRGEITEEELSDADRKKIIMFYHKQNEAGTNIYAIIEKHRLDAEFKIGAGITKLRQAYSGKSANPITEDEKRRAEKIGAIKIADMEAEQKRLQEKLEKAEALKQEAEAQAGKVK